VKKLRCVSSYRNQDEGYTAGQVFEAEDEPAEWLMNDAPGSFELVQPTTEKPKTRRVAKPPKTTAVQAKDAEAK